MLNVTRHLSLKWKIIVEKYTIPNTAQRIYDPNGGEFYMRLEKLSIDMSRT